MNNDLRKSKKQRAYQRKDKPKEAEQLAQELKEEIRTLRPRGENPPTRHKYKATLEQMAAKHK